MATSEPLSVSEGMSASPSPEPMKRLRVWPAALCLLLIVGTRLPAYLMEELPTVFYQILFMGPMVATLLTLLWLVFFSRAALVDRLLVPLALIGVGAATFFAAHDTVRGMAFLFFALPLGMVAFLTTVLLLYRIERRAALWVAGAAAILCFAAADTVRNNGFSGDFGASFDWRWIPSAEEHYLAQRQSHELATTEGKGELGPVLWAGFRGPNRDGVVPGIKLAEDWKAQPPKEIWRRRIGPGWGSFSLAGNRLFTMEQHDKVEAVVCLDADTGAEVWSYEYPSRFTEAVAGPGPRATPTLHDGALYTLGAEGILLRLNPTTGKVVWERNLCKDSKTEKPPMWGFAASPLVANGLVIVHAGGVNPDTGLTLAFDSQTGEPRWTAPAGNHSYSSAQLSTIAGKPSILMVTNAGLHAYEPTTGKVLWDHEWAYKLYRVNQPLVIGESSVLLGTAMDAGTRRIDVTADGKTTNRWTSMAMKPGFNDFVAHKGYLYGFDLQIFACIDLEAGTRQWKDGRYGSGQVLLLPDADQLLVVSEKGELVLLRANSKKREELTRFSAISGKTWNHPILVGNRVYLRNGEEAACYEMPLAEKK